MPDTKKQVRVRLHQADLIGEMLLEGQRIAFTARIDGPKVDVEFADPGVDQWTAFRALDRWIDENLRG